MPTKRYRKKPVVIEAMQLTKDNAEEVAEWCDGRTWIDPMLYPEKDRVTIVIIDTLEGSMEAHPDDFVICGVKGEFYPCKPDIFASTYEEA